ncbi:AAA family ATPase [Bacillus sp. AFS096315]|uniref:ATP-dependent nuclease n=1 Tax=Bacillus sp. AFS096315 TaxID=2033517 RepID=UPI000BED1AF2|nr:AAA family ATPase [Bacillus sp. AFS096315]PEC46371.1 ATP-dependent endonuclease [Bacillus sp. AFS096315]
MNIPKSPYISRVKIVNFRNFKEIDVNLSHKQIIIGENSVGKTNFLRAIQIILDPKLSDEDRFLLETDFFDGLSEPMKKGEEVEILIELQGYDHNKTLLSILDAATISKNPNTIRLTYKYSANQKEDGTYDYQYTIFQGIKEDVPFTSYHRKFLNVNVINAIRDVESELRHIRKSPVNMLLKQYDIRKEELVEIASALKQKSDEVLSIDELVDLTQNINSRFSNIIGSQVDSSVSLETIDVDPNRVLNTLKLMIGQKKRQTSDTSLGINNILYISLILLALEDKTIPNILKEDRYKELIKEDDSEILNQCYDINENRNFILKKENPQEKMALLYTFMDNFSGVNKGFTILAIEEPESHLHPALQRIIYKDVMNQNTSILMTTHSPHITSVAPINSIVHLRPSLSGTKVNTTAFLKLEPRNRMDLERYIDIKRGELYFGRGVILVEGVAEEYMIPSFAEILGMPLDQKGIICCNVNSTNFKPYVKFLESLGIPYVVVTDGDYYVIEEVEDKEKKEKKEKKKFGLLHEESHDKYGYDGLDRIKELLIELNKVDSKDIPFEYPDQDVFYADYGYFSGVHTFEIDIMDNISEMRVEKDIICMVFNELTLGGEGQKNNFKTELDNGDFVSCLNKIESSHSGIGKGRFAQHLSVLRTENHVPNYIRLAIESIYSKVDDM